MQFKERLHFHDDGVARFDNSMDALSIMNDNVPAMKKFINSAVSKINKERKAGDEEYLSLQDYGTDNAEAKRIERDQKNAPKAPKASAKIEM